MVTLTKEQDLEFKKYENKLDLLRDIHNLDTETLFDDVSWDRIMDCLFEGYDIEGLNYDDLPEIFNFKSKVNLNAKDIVYRGMKLFGEVVVSWETSKGHLGSDRYASEEFLKYVNAGKFEILN